MAKKTSIPPETIALYEKLIATNPDVERRGVLRAFRETDRSAPA